MLKYRVLERDRILGGTAVAFYHLSVTAPPLQ
jgi:hypothetical protein